MELGLGAGLPLYAGGLGILAGNFLKTASDLGIPVIHPGISGLSDAFTRKRARAAGALAVFDKP